MSRKLAATHPLYGTLPTIHSHHDQLWGAVPEHFLTEFDRTFDFRGDDVWISSYPRSGTAWTYEVVQAVLHGGDIAALERAQKSGDVPRFLPLEIGSANAVADRLGLWRDLPSPRVIPSHLPYRLFPPSPAGEQRKRIFVLRHPKDVAVSFYHFHRSHRILGYYTGTWSTFLDCFLSGSVVCGSWFDHTLGWWRYAHDSADEVLVLHYEQLKHDTAAQIRRIAGFLGVDLSTPAVAAIEDYSSFDSMSANPFTNREGIPIMDFSIAPFLRRGEVDGWRSQFSAEQNERFRSQWERELAGSDLRLAYAV